MAGFNFSVGSGEGQGAAGCFGRIFQAGFFSVFLGMGLLFFVLLLRSILQGEPKTLVFFLLLPLVFVVVGAAGLYSAIRGPKPKPAPESGLSEALSSKATDPRKGAWFMVLFFAVFLAVGLAVSYALLFRPALKLVKARHWAPTACTILSSDVGRHSGSKGGSTYSIDITYEYEAPGGIYRSGDYDFMGASSSGYDGKADVVKRYPPGIRATCYVNPEDPREAVLNRDFQAEYLIGLFPLLFVFVGLVGMPWAYRKARQASHPSDLRAGTIVAARGPVELKVPAGPVAKLFGAILVAAFWNGIVSVFVWQMVEGWRHGHPDACLTLFMIPFVAVGLGLIGLIGYQFLALFNPRLHVTLSEQAVPLGSSADLEWRFSGSASRIERLTMTLEGREEATYRRGTSTSTDKHVFCSVELVALPAGSAVASGRTRVEVPAGTAPTFEASNNKILWSVKVHADIPRWPDVIEEFPLRVLPAGGAP
jgi:hypothetical protein